VADSVERVAKQLAAALEPFAAALGREDDDIIAFVEQLGWSLPSVPAGIKALASSARTIVELGTALQFSEGVEASGGAVTVDAAKYTKLAAAIVDLIHRLDQLPAALNGQLPAAFLGATDFAAQFGRRLLDRAVVLLLSLTTKRIEPILRLAGIIEVVDEPESAAAFQPAYRRRTVHWERIGDLLGNPPKLLRDAYGWGTSSFDAEVLFDSIMHLSFVLGGPAALDWPTPERIQALTGTLPAFDQVGPPAIIVPFVEHDAVQAGASVLPLPAHGGQPPGVALGVFVDASLPPQLQLNNLIALRIDAPTELAAGISVALRPGVAPQVRLGLEGSAGASPVAPKVGLAVVVGKTQPIEVFELPGGTTLEIGSITVAGGVGARPTGAQPYVDIAVEKGKLTLALGGGDGFLAKIMPGGPMELTFDLGMTWTPAGVQFRGSGALTLSVPLHLDLGPFHLETLFIVVGFDGNGLALETSVSGGASLGPLKAVVERVGITTTLAFHHGNLGPVDLGIAFKPPTGVGLSLDAGVVSGGGYLFIDSARGEYAGALELSLFEVVTIKAIGLITTKTPDGKPGFSLLIIMSVEFGSGFQLGFGFTLNAVGGLLGLNRTMNLDALAEGVRNGSLDSIMFPKDIITNAPKIISDLRAFFPPKDGTFLIGPMVKIGWGTPTLASISLGIIVEIPGNIAIVGIITVAIPTEDAPLILLQVNFLGAIELDKQRVWFFASLFGSRIVFLTIEGEMGLLMAYGDEPNFVLTVGGFHPRFSPPPLPFPSPKRIAVNLLSTPVSRMRIEGYFAVTTNTVQFGARVDVMFGLDEINVKGNLAFDALFQFSPFHFEIDISASLSVNVFGVGLFSVGISGQLDGPSPWHVKGHGSISLLFWDIDVDFETT
jgi:hypothetical protein